jgi:predicted unusual protein kinase regulating ubiquinone biosynthesis (AarF/ABC1/UbiB family)
MGELMLKQSIAAYKIVKNIKKAKHSTTEKERYFAVNALHEIFLKERGIFFKLGQTIGASHDNSKFKELEDLTYKTESPFSLEELLDFYRNKLDLEAFEEINESLTPGSIGQVHRAKDIKGNQFAIKIQYPNIKEKMHEQLSLLKLMPIADKLTNFNKWHFPINDYRNMLQEVIDNECCYKKEIENHNIFKNNLTGIENVNIPIIHENLSNNFCLVSDWVDGNNINNIINAPVNVKRLWAETLLKVYLKNLLIDGFIQADHHDGNFIFNITPSPTVTYIDLGNCLKVPPLMSKALIRLIQDIHQNRESDLLTLFNYLDFDQDKLSHLKESLAIMSNIIFEPFTSDYAFDLKLWNLDKKMEHAFGDNKWWFRSAGGPLFFQILRSFLGLKNLLEKLDTPIMWKKIFLDLTEEIKPTLNEFPNKVYSKNIPQFPDMAKNLIINVIRDGNQKAHITLPSSVVIELNEVIDKEIKEKIEKRGMNIDSIIQQAVKNGLKPQLLFLLDEDDDEFKVYLE